MTFSFSLFFSKRFWTTLLILLAALLFFTLRSTTARVLIENLTPPELPAATPAQNRVALAQNWDPETTEKFHFISQGTGTLPVPYSWLLALEQPEASPFGLLWPDREPRITEPGYLERYGFISSPASPGNPDGLPIGFAATPFQNLAGLPETATAVGFTCAACHTGRFSYEGTEYIVEGGPAVTDLQQFSKGLGAALGQTLLSSKLPLPNRRFDRFARNVLGETYSQTAKAPLAKNLETVLAAGAKAADVIEVTEGYGRLDALNRIGNQVFSKNTGRRENYTPINAPVNYPHIWTASWFDWVQYDGSIMQPLVRNAGEAMGVHAAVNTTAPAGEGRFSSSVPVKNLKWIEDSLAGKEPPFAQRKFGGLRAPQWPDSLPAINQGLADQGAGLYAGICAGCHLPPLSSDAIWSDSYFRKISYTAGGTGHQTREAFLALNILPQADIGTDPAQGAVLAERTVNTAGDVESGAKGMGIDAAVCAPEPRFEGRAQYASSALDTKVQHRTERSENQLVQVHVQDGPMVSFALALGAIVQQVNSAWFEASFIPRDLRTYFEGERPNCLQAGAGYKARPLNGVWATAPFLHNGSVPTLDALLRPAAERPRYVQLGDPAFDPVKVGLAQPVLQGEQPLYKDGYFILDTAKDGNRNTGHSFEGRAGEYGNGVVGRALSDQERAALIEYLKTL
ncbi:MAG: di-heme-cytochrome C peroxidase [Leisingera sp.]